MGKNDNYRLLSRRTRVGGFRYNNTYYCVHGWMTSNTCTEPVLQSLHCGQTTGHINPLMLDAVHNYGQTPVGYNDTN